MLGRERRQERREGAPSENDVLILAITAVLDNMAHPAR
jgi:hypothetical protein